MSRVRDDLVRQRNERLRLREATARQLAEHDKDIDELNVAITAIDRNAEATAVEKTKVAELTHNGRLTIQEMVLQILSMVPDGATANQIIEHIKARFNITVERTSLSPQLSRLKAEAKIALLGKTWVLADPDDTVVSTTSRVMDQLGLNDEELEPAPQVSVLDALNDLFKDGRRQGDASQLLNIHIGAPRR